MGVAAGGRGEQIAQARQSIGCGFSATFLPGDCSEFLHCDRGQVATYIITEPKLIGHSKRHGVNIFKHRAPGYTGRVGGRGQVQATILKQGAGSLRPGGVQAAGNVSSANVVVNLFHLVDLDQLNLDNVMTSLKLRY